MTDTSNTGHCNTGHCNTGDYNTGHCNTGDYNTGDYNTGDYNTGSCNTGYYNAGHCNTGSCNTGDYNAGNCNTGSRNTGSCNTGYYNAGNFCTGDYNTGNRNTGYFCTGTPRPTFFNSPTDITWEEAQSIVPNIDLPVGCKWIESSAMTDEEKSQNPSHTTTGGFLRAYNLPYKDAWSVAWRNMDESTRQRFLDLPNFNAEIFMEITGIDVRKDRAATVKVQLPDGRVIEIEGKVV